MPDVPFSSFLTTCSGSGLRYLFYDFYTKGEEEAKSLVKGWMWWPIQQVLLQEQGRDGLWIPDRFLHTATIFIHAGDIVGEVFHEVFHSAFAGSPLFATNECWGDAFCNAFQYCVEKKYMQNSQRLAEVNERIAKGQPVRTDCAYPDPILERCNKDYDQFKNLWAQLQALPKVSLYQVFKVGQPRVWA